MVCTSSGAAYEVAPIRVAAMAALRMSSDAK